jgi:predicted nucleic acid-binding Zn ribbon protein
MNNNFNDKWLKIRRSSKRKKYNKLESILSEWYGKDIAKNEITAYLPKPIPIQDTLNKLMSETSVPEQGKLMRLQKEWSSLVGDQVGKISKPVSIKDGYLTIEVANSIWLMELKNYSGALIEEKVRSLCGKRFFKKLLFIPSGKNKKG